jgi:hypothetical protein
MYRIDDGRMTGRPFKIGSRSAEMTVRIEEDDSVATCDCAAAAAAPYWLLLGMALRR